MCAYCSLLPVPALPQSYVCLAGQAVPNPKREDVDAITDYFNINAGNPVQCLTQARLPGRRDCQWCVCTELSVGMLIFEPHPVKWLCMLSDRQSRQCIATNDHCRAPCSRSWV